MYVYTGNYTCTVLNTSFRLNVSSFQLFLKLCQQRNPSSNSERCEKIPDIESHEENDGHIHEHEFPPVGSVFEDVTQSLQVLKDHMIGVIVDHVVQGFRMLSKPYKKEK